MTTLPFKIVVVGLIGGLGVAACTDDRLSKPEFIARADDICRTTNARVMDLGRPRNAAEFEEFVTEGEDLSEEMISGLEELDPPEADEEEIDAMIDRIEEATSLLPELREAARERDFAAVQETVEEIQVLASRTEEFAADYGFEECGRLDVAPS